MSPDILSPTERAMLNACNLAKAQIEWARECEWAADKIYASGLVRRMEAELVNAKRRAPTTRPRRSQSGA